MAFRDESPHGVDADTGLVRSMRATAANVHDITEAHNLLHGGGDDGVVCDAGYQGVHKRAENLGGRWTGKSRWAWSEEAVAEKLKASVRAKSLPPTAIGVEHPFLKVKRVFSYREGTLPGLAKNTQRLALLLGLGNLMTAEGQLSG